jgi:hypothetical protein
MKTGKLTPITLGLAWLASLGVVFVLGILLAFAFHLDPRAESAAAAAPLEERELSLLLERHLGEPLDSAALRDPGDNQIAPQIDQLVRTLLREPQPLRRSADALRLAEVLPSRQLMGAIRMLGELPADPARNDVLGHFLSRWGHNDGRSAVAFVSSLPASLDRDQSMGAVLNGWSKKRPREAWSWVVERYGTPRRAQPWLGIILSNLMYMDRAQAIELLHALPVSVTQDELAELVVVRLLDSLPPAEVVDWLVELPEATLASAMARLAVEWSKADPPSAAMWLYDNMADDIVTMETITREWTYRNPPQAASWVWEHYHGEDCRQLLEAVAREWVAMEGPAPLARWLNDNGPGGALDSAIEVLALATAPLDPSTALVWVQSISDSERREMLEIFIGREWLLSDPEEAGAALPLLVTNPRSRAALMQEASQPDTPHEEDDLAEITVPEVAEPVSGEALDEEALDEQQPLPPQ